MHGSLVILTGASGAGKTAIAKAIEAEHPSITVFRFDTIGVPSEEVMASFGTGYQPGGAWQRAMTLKWFERIVEELTLGKTVLFEGQMRIAFIQEALTAFAIKNARILCVECDDATRNHRLTHDRLQPELANESMAGWSRYLHQEATQAGYEVLDTTKLSLAESVRVVQALLEKREAMKAVSSGPFAVLLLFYRVSTNSRSSPEKYLLPGMRELRRKLGSRP
jgi:predicted kinase